MKKSITAFIFIIAVIVAGCKTSQKFTYSLPKNWLNISTYRINSIGYPSTNLNNTSYELEAYEASYNLALAKITEAFVNEIPGFKNENYAALTESIKKNIKILKQEYNGKYTEITAEVKVQNLLNILRKGEIVF